VLLKLGRAEQALRCFEHALSIDPYFEAASEGKKQAEDDIRKNKIEDYARSVLDFEYANGRPVTKEEAFKICGIPYAFLGDVLEFLSGKEDINLSNLPKEDFERYEKISREILVNTMEKRDLAAHGLRLCDITVSFPELKISSAKRILSYIHSVEQHQFSTKAMDEQTEVMLRQAIDLPNDQKNVLGLIRNLGVGAYRARQLVTILHTFQGGGFETPAIQVRSILSESYGRYSPYDERAARRTHPDEQPREDMRPRRRREEGYVDHQVREEEPQDPRALEPRRYPREEPPRRERRDREQEAPPRERRDHQGDHAPKDVPSDLVGRRCLFHGGIAVARCQKCKAVLCRECIRGSEKCPRCNAPLGGPVEPEAEKRPPPRAEHRREEVEEEPEEEAPRKKSTEQRPKKKHDEGDELSRL
jgi:hypothetical protein